MIELCFLQKVPNLFTKDDLSAIFDQCRAEAKKANAGDTDDELYSFFMEKARKNMHIVLCLSPVQESFHRRLQMFPGLVNCSTIDWYLFKNCKSIQILGSHNF
jgi:dynein heavy chain